jgi:hypothetical protein
LRKAGIAKTPRVASGAGAAGVGRPLDMGMSLSAGADRAQKGVGSEHSQPSHSRIRIGLDGLHLPLQIGRVSALFNVARLGRTPWRD